MEHDGEVDNRPLTQRLVDKKWSTRNKAYAELTTLFSNCLDDTLFDEYASFMPEIANDSNANALDTGLSTLLEFADKSPNAKRIAGELAPKIIDKTFGARTSTLEKGKQVLMKLMEIDTPESVTNALLGQLSNKKAKIPPVCVQTITEAVVAFGARSMPLKEMLPQLQGMFESTNAGVRDGAMTLMVELAKWIGLNPLQAVKEHLRSTQKTQFDQLIAEITPGRPPLPTIGLRKDRARLQAQAQGSGEAKTVAAAPEPEIDPRDLVQEVDILARTRTPEYAQFLSENKWSEQIQALQMIIDAIGSVPKIAAGDFSDLMQTLKGFVNHSHIQLNTAAIRIIGLMAQGLRENFTSYVRPLVHHVVVKSKEKRLCAVITESLQAVFRHCLTLEQDQEELIEHIRGTYSQKKVPPHARVCVMEVVEFVVKQAPAHLPPTCATAYVNALLSCVEDSDPKVREASCTAAASFVAYCKRLGKRGSEALGVIQGLQNSNARVFKKIMDLFTQSQSGAASSAAVLQAEALLPPPPPSAAEEKAQSVGAGGTAEKKSAKPKPRAVIPSGAPKDDTSEGMEALPARNQSPKRAAAKPLKRASAKPDSSSGAGSKKATKASGQEEKDDEPGEIAMSVEEANEVMEQLGVANWSSVQAQLNSDKWTEKQEALKAISDTFTSRGPGSVSGDFSVAVVVFLQQLFPGMRISNINLLKAVLECLKSCASACDATHPFDKRAAAAVLPLCADKLTEKKLQTLVQELLLALCECTSPNFVVKRIAKLTCSKAPAAHVAFLELLCTCVNEFGAKVFNIQHLVSLCLEEMENKQATVRAKAIEALGCLYKQLGPPFSSLVFAGDIKAALRTACEEEFNKVGYDPSQNTAPSRSIKGEEGVSSSALGGSLIPRHELGTLVARDILARMSANEGKNAWQTRKAAIEEVINACARASNYLDTKGVGEVLKALKARLNDSQGNLKPLACTAISQIITSLDTTQWSKFVRFVSEGLFAGVNDNKKQMRDASVECLDKCITIANSPSAACIDALLPAMTSALASSTVGRMEILTWINKYTSILPSNTAPGELAATLVTCMQDKTASVRQAAEICLGSLIKGGILSRQLLEAAMRDLSPAAKRTLEPIVARMFESVSVRTLPVAESKEPIPEAKGRSSSRPKTAQRSSSSNLIANPPQDASTKLPEEVAEPVESRQEDLPLRPCASSAKARRIDDFQRLNWPVLPAEPKEPDMLLLKDQWSPLLSAEAVTALFPPGPCNMEHVCAGIELLRPCVQLPVFQTHLDLVLRWTSIYMCTRENVKGLQVLLEFLLEVMTMLSERQYTLNDVEANVLVPYIIEKGGNPKERFRTLFKHIGATTCHIYNPQKYVSMCIQALTSKSSRTRVFALEEMSRCVIEGGVAVFGKKGLASLGPIPDARETEVRNAALDVLYDAYEHMDHDAAKLFRVLGNISDKARALIEDRIKERNKRKGVTTMPNPTVTPASFPSTSGHTAPQRAASRSGDINLREEGPYNMDLSPEVSRAISRQEIREDMPVERQVSICTDRIEEFLAYTGGYDSAHPLYVQCKRHLKHLNWALGSSSQQITPFADDIVTLTSRCMKKGLDVAPSDWQLPVDTSLTAIALVTMHKCIQQPSTSVSVTAMESAVAVVMYAYEDNKLGETSRPLVEEYHQIHGALGIFLSTAIRAAPTVTLCALIGVMLRTVSGLPMQGTNSYPLHAGTVDIMQAHSIFAVKNLPVIPNNSGLRSICEALHFFLVSYPSLSPDCSYRAIRNTVVALKKRYGEKLVQISLEVCDTNSRLYRLLTRPEPRKTEAHKSDVKQSPSLARRVDENVPKSIEETSSNPSPVENLLSSLISKMSGGGTSTMQVRLAYKRLHNHLVSHPEVDIEAYLCKIPLEMQNAIRSMLEDANKPDADAAIAGYDPNLVNAVLARSYLRSSTSSALGSAPDRPLQTLNNDRIAPTTTVPAASPRSPVLGDAEAGKLYNTLHHLKLSLQNP